MSGRLPACAMHEPLPARVYANCAASGDGTKRKKKGGEVEGWGNKEEGGCYENPESSLNGLTVKRGVRDKGPNFP